MTAAAPLAIPAEVLGYLDVAGLVIWLPGREPMYAWNKPAEIGEIASGGIEAVTR